jgi:hypothetical protein
VITPSLPTLSIASAMMLADLVLVGGAGADLGDLLLLLTGMLIFSSSPTMARRPASMPRFRAMGLAPAATFFRPSVKMASA